LDKKNTIQDSDKKTANDAATKISSKRNGSGTQNGYIGGDFAGSSSGHQFHEKSGEK
jgi:hypothetical protein